MSCAGVGPGVLEVVETARPGDRSVRGPDRPDDADGLLQSIHRLPRRQLGATHPGDRVEEVAGAQTQLHPPVRQQVEARCGAGQHGRGSQWQARDVREQADGVGGGRQVGEQCPGVEQVRVVRMVLYPDEVQAALLGELGEPDNRGGLGGRIGQEDAKRQLVAEVRHAGLPPCAGGGDARPAVRPTVGEVGQAR